MTGAVGLSSTWRSLGVLATVLLAGQLAPALTTIPALRHRVFPGLHGSSNEPHLALTYDDGPDPRSTPRFLDLLEEHGVHATFFVLGEHLQENAVLVREMSDRGHELAVHGWDHRCLAWKRPGSVRPELTRTRDLIAEITGRQPSWYRPPYGVLTADGLYAARASRLTPVLWSAWGRDWERGATAERVAHRVGRVAGRGSTVLLHDTDRTSAQDSWRATLAASELLLDDWRRRQWSVGTLREHAHPAGSWAIR